jgi:hypothetical protein
VLLNSFLKTNLETLIINPEASSGKNENDIEEFCNALENQLGKNIKIKY